MSAVRLCPECLTVVVDKCPKHRTTKAVTVGYYKARIPRQAANNRKWREYLNMFVHDPEEKKLFKLLNPKITEAQREEYWNRLEVMRREAERRAEAQSKLQRERFDHELERIRESQEEKPNEPFTERKIKALSGRLKDWIDKVKLKPLRIAGYEVTTDPSMVMVTLSICESPEFEFEIPDMLLLTVEKDWTKLFNADQEEPYAKEILGAVQKIRDFEEGLNKCFKAEIVFYFVLDSSYYEIRRVATKSW